MSGSIGKGATGIIDQIIVFLTFRQEHRERLLFDNIAQNRQQQVVQVPATLPMDFESSTIAYSFVGFDGGAVTKLLILIAQE
jgi:hypothetical protein